MDEETARRHAADRLAAYINGMEAAVCGLLHIRIWPECEDASHDEGRSLLAGIDRQARAWKCPS